MDLDSAIEVVIGPYETYEDELFGYKAAFEAFVCVGQPEDSARLAVFKSELPFLERSLPIPDEHKNLARGTESPIRVVDEIFTAGDTRAGVQTIAFNLPNDERVREAKGSKKVLLKNVMRAKFDAILVPIAERVLPEEESRRRRSRPSSSSPCTTSCRTASDRARSPSTVATPRSGCELKDLYSAFEEAKADVLGVYDIYRLVEKGVMDPAILESLPWSYTAGMFRATRFGVAEAHGLGIVLQANYLIASGAVEITDDGRFRPVPSVFDETFRRLAHELLMIQALGDYDAARGICRAFRLGQPGDGRGHRQPVRPSGGHRALLSAGGAAMSAGFEGRVAIVGGSSSGLGFAVAENLAAHGARVLVVSRSAERVSVAVDAMRRARRWTRQRGVSPISPIRRRRGGWWRPRARSSARPRSSLPTAAGRPGCRRSMPPRTTS